MNIDKKILAEILHKTLTTYNHKHYHEKTMPLHLRKRIQQIIFYDPTKDFSRVQVTDVVYDKRGPIMKYEPGHADANAEGFVAYPNINLMEEMTNMIQATRSYEANVQAVQATKDMALSALEIGR